MNTFAGAPIFIARMIAKKFGLDPDRDLKFLASGLPEARLLALSQGSASGAMLPVPWDFRATKMGFISLARAHELFTIEDVKKAAKVEREVAFSEVADLSILREAQMELGIKGK